MTKNSRISALRSRRVLIGATAVVVLAGIGAGVATAVDGDDDKGSSGRDDHSLVTGAEATSIGEAAKSAASITDAGVLKIEQESEHGTVTYEVTLVTAGGAETEVHLTKDLTLIPEEAEHSDTDHEDSDERTVNGVRIDEEDGAISDAQLTQISDAVLAAVPGGTVVSVESHKPDSHDTGAEAEQAYEVEVTTGSGTDLRHFEVALDAKFQVLAPTAS